MADKRLTQSPRALRESTNDAEKDAKGEVQLNMNAPRKSGGPESERGGDWAASPQGWPRSRIRGAVSAARLWREMCRRLKRCR